MEKHQKDEIDTVFHSLLTSDVGDGFPVLTEMAAITLACPLGTAGNVIECKTVLVLITRPKQFCIWLLRVVVHHPIS